MICPKCSFENIPGAKFCNECGSPLTDSGKIAGLSVEPEKHADSPRGDLDTSKIPDIRIPGVNADETDDASVGQGVLDQSGEDGFDFDPIDDEEEPEYGDWGPYAYDPDSDGTTKRIQDTRGIDEFLVEPGYTPPAPAWKTGDTMEMPKVEGGATPQKKEFKAPDAEKKRGGKGRFVIIGLIVVLVACAAAAGITYSMELWGGKTVPNVEGMQKQQAIDELEALGFTVRTTEVKSDDAADTVLLMDPNAGSRMEEGTEIVLHLAVNRAVPGVVGMTQEEAADAFEAEGLENIEYVTEKSNEAEGTVLSVDPEAGAKALSNQKITVTVAEAYIVPDVAGMSESEALAALADAGYAGYSTYVYAENPEGTAIGTDPEAGSKIASGTDVGVMIAKSRANEVIALTNEYLGSAGTVTIGGTTYEIVSVDGSATYKGDNTTETSVTVRAMTTLDGETVYGSSKQRTITIVWSSENTVESVS